MGAGLRPWSLRATSEVGEVGTSYLEARVSFLGPGRQQSFCRMVDGAQDLIPRVLANIPTDLYMLPNNVPFMRPRGDLKSFCSFWWVRS